jgi:hypothetical protein
LWSGLTYSLDAVGLDLSRSQFIEVWVSDWNDHHDPTQRVPRVRGDGGLLQAGVRPVGGAARSAAGVPAGRTARRAASPEAAARRTAVSSAWSPRTNCLVGGSPSVRGAGMPAMGRRGEAPACRLWAPLVRVTRVSGVAPCRTRSRRLGGVRL